MPVLSPPDPDFASEAEHTVWERLASQLPDDAILIANQRITAGGEEVELDLLVLWPGMGIVAIEVKGGLVSVRDGVWLQSDRSGAHNLRRSPITQAQSARHALLHFLNERSSRPIGRSVHMVALPYTEVPATWDVPDAPRALVLDTTDLPQIMDRLAYALRTVPRDHHAPLDALQAEDAVKALRATHLAITNHQALARRIEDAGNTFSREQERAVALLRLQHRAQVIGGAGSGKTHLAMIKARTLARDGFRTALLCYSRGLARHFQLLSATWPEEERPAFVGLFHDLPVRWGAGSPEEFDGEQADYYEEYLPRRLAEVAAAQGEDELFDAIVVDEAQDFADIWWDGLLLCLRDQQDGVLFVFTDEHQTVFDREGRAPITLNPFPLDDNLRNSGRIAKTFAALTPLSQNPRMEEGLPVRFVQSSTDSAVGAADDVVDGLLDEGWDSGDIALLTTGSRHPEQKAQIEISGFDGYWDQFFAAEDVFYGHVLNFKGLERRVVVLAVNGFQSLDRAPQLLYVGLSRARSLLVVVGDAGGIWDVGGGDVWAAIDKGVG